MRKSRKLQLKAMNVALENYSEQSAKDAGLSKLERVKPWLYLTVDALEK